MQSEINPFQEDLYPGRPKILFIGLAASSHTHSWMRLLEGARFNVRLYGITWGLPPKNWPFPTYTTEQNIPHQFANDLVQSFYPWPEMLDAYEAQLQEYKEQEIAYKTQIHSYAASLVDRIRQQRRYTALLDTTLKKEFANLLSDYFLSYRSYDLQYIAYSLDYINYCLDFMNREGSAKRAFLRAVQKRINQVADLLKLPIRRFEIMGLAALREYNPKPYYPDEYQLKEYRPEDFGFPGSLLEEVPPVPMPPMPPQPPINKAQTPDHWLGKIIAEWKPDIIHTLGIFDGQGGEFYYRVRKNCHLETYGKWVLQLRGGSDLTLRYRDPQFRPLIQEMLTSSDQILTDNKINLAYAAEMGIPSSKFSSLVPVPGTGGIDVQGLRAKYSTPPSMRERIILVAKSYESIWSKVTPVIEALRIAWPSIQPCKVIFTAAIEETRIWIKNLPEDMLQNCLILDRVNREEFLDILGSARVVLSPSLIDGIPNVLYEAMACGTFPIVSPLETIRSVVGENQGLLFARNLYPDEIAEALVQAMRDDNLVDDAFEKNYEFVRHYANRAKIQPAVIDFYENIANG